MNNFVQYTPTKVVFGKGTEMQAGDLIKADGGSRVFVVYGGGSAVKSGLLGRVTKSIEDAGLAAMTYGGVKPNPTLAHAEEGVRQAVEFGADYILGVGGGSVIDTAKAIAHGTSHPDAALWDIWYKKVKITKSLPIACVLTIAAAGSEMSADSVLTNEENGKKKGFGTDLNRCRFAIMNPELLPSVPDYYFFAGVADIMMHTMERYFSKDVDMTLTDEIAEALMRNVKDSVFYVLKNPNDYRHRAQIMWAGSLSHNDLTGCGTRRDFASHKLEHEISALFDVAHGAGLAAIWGSWARYVMNENVSRFVRFAVNVMGVANDYTDAEGTALRGIEAMERFYRAIGMPTCISELLGRTLTDAELDQLASQCSKGGTITIGGFKVLHEADMRKIYSLANK